MTRITLPAERKVGHMTLLRRERDISKAEYNALSEQEQLEMIRQASGKQKYELILNSSNADRLVPRLHPQELYLTINQLGPEDSNELLSLASTEQMTTLLDLDCWDGDTLSPVLSLQWLELLLYMGEKQVCDLVRTIEPEILALFLKKHLVITRGIEAYDDDEAENAYRLESLYDVSYHSEDAAKVIGRLLKIWQEHEQESFLLLMEMVRSENLSVLEEEVYQARSNRLLDFGLIPALEARSIYTFIDPDNFIPVDKRDARPQAEELPSPTAILYQAQADNMLAEAISRGLDHETACELLMLLNRKMSADQTDISSPAEVSSTLQSTYDTLNLALEYLAGQDGERADEIFRSVYLLQLFQLGHSLIKRLQERSRRLLDTQAYPFFDYPELLFVDSLLQSPACFYRQGCDDNPSDLRPLTTFKDLQLVEIRLSQIEALVELFEGTLPFSLPESDANDGNQPTLSGLFMTAIGNRLLGREFAPQPLSETDLTALQEKTIKNSCVAPEFKAELLSLLDRLAPECSFFSRFCLEIWEDCFLGYDSETPAPFQGCLILQT